MSAAPFAIRGLIEGFYGTYYTHPERLELLRFLGAQGYNLYIYAPKHDRQHRARWREPYPAGVMEQFGEAVAVARESGVDFCYSLSPGVAICYSSPDDFAAITAKFDAFYRLGVRSFSLLLDDILPVFRFEADRDRYGSYAEAHADLCNRVYRWLVERDPHCSLSMCPTEYHGRPPFGDYLHELGERLHPDIDVMYTGPEVCSSAIGLAEVADFAAAVRRPPLIWDNYPVNDLAMERELHLGPIGGRDALLPQSARGFVVNPMNQPEASKVALATFADYLADPASYDPDRAWSEALAAVAGQESACALRLFAEHSLESCLHQSQSDTLRELTLAVTTSLHEGDGVTGNMPVAALEAYLDEVDEACYHLKYRMGNLVLRAELVPWIELLEHWIWAARYALQALEAQECGEDPAHPLRMAREFFDKARTHHKRLGGAELSPLVTFALEGVAEAVAS